MIQQFESLVGLKVDGMIQKQFEEGIVESMKEEVAKENSSNESFMTQDIVSNVVDRSPSQMQGEIASKSSIF